MRTAADWARRNWPILWPNLVMAGSMLAGILLGLLVVNTVRPASELAANVLLGACMVGAMTLAFTVLGLVGRAVVPRVPAIAAWGVVLALAAGLLLIL